MRALLLEDFDSAVGFWDRQRLYLGVPWGGGLG